MEIDKKTKAQLPSSLRPSWDSIFMHFCEILAKESTCARIQTAAIIVKEKNNIVSMGYNGSCEGKPHCIDLWWQDFQQTQQTYPNVTWDQYLSSNYFIEKHGEFSIRNEMHGELNAIINLASNDSSCKGARMYTLYSPCINCAKLIVKSKIKEVVYKVPYDRDSTGIDFLKENGVLVIKYQET